MTDRLRPLRAMAWGVVAVVGALAGAGLVLALDHPASDAARPELVARGGALLAPRLAALDPALDRLAAATVGLGTAGREVFTGLRSVDLPAAEAALLAGGTALDDVEAAAADVAAGRPGLLEGLRPIHLPTADRERVAAIDAALAGAAALGDSWAAIVDDAAGPVRFVRAVREHASRVATAVAAGHAQRYPDARGSLLEAGVAITDALAVVDAARASGRDTSALDAPLAELLGYDTALAELYELLEASGGVRTAAVDTALAVVRDAQAALPDDEQLLADATGSLGGDDITLVLLEMEDVRGAVEAAALGADDVAPSPSNDAGG